MLFVRLAFADQTLYLFGGVGSFAPGGPAYSPLATFPYGQTWTGLGWLAKVSTIPQTTKIQAQNVTLSLAGIPSALVLEAVNQVRINGVATVWLGFFDVNGNLIADPVQLFAGALDVPTINDSGATCSISITAENPLLRLNDAPERLFDDADQQIYYPGDLGFSFVDALANLALYWPSPYSAAGGSDPYPISMGLLLGANDIAVGGTTQLYIQINYSDGSYYKEPGASGAGVPFTASVATSNPRVAKISLSGVVTGVSPGTCSLMGRVPYPLRNPNPPGGEYRAACNIIVHS